MKITVQPPELEYRWHDVAFKIRARATVRDKSAMADLFADTVEDGKFKASKTKLYPWVIERFVTGWEGVMDDGKKPVPWSLDALMSLPADEENDIIMVLGAFILNHTGMRKADESKKKG
jgi:hypothetical protein